MNNFPAGYGALTEILTWQTAADLKIGALSDPADAEHHSARVAVKPMKSSTTDQTAGGDADVAEHSISAYELLGWSKGALGGIETGQQCELTKYGAVKIRSKIQRGMYGIMTELRAEAIA